MSTHRNTLSPVDNLNLSKGQQQMMMGFGVPQPSSHDYFPHYFIVKIGKSSVDLIEDLGELEDTHVHRSSIARWKWDVISGATQRDFRERLKANGFNTKYRWRVAKDNPVYNLLGKELTTLFWALEFCETKEDVEYALRGWLALRPEERWWLFGMAARDGVGHKEHSGEHASGWRKAIYHALGERPKNAKRVTHRGDPRYC